MGRGLNGKELGKGIYQRKDGSFCGRFVNRFGKRESVYAPTFRELKQKMEDTIRSDITHTNIQKDFTLDQWFEQWMDVYKYQVRENTRRHYRQVYEKHIKPVLGCKSLKDITTLEIRRLINSLDKAGYQYETKDKVKVILIDMFDRAMNDDFALKNPARPIKLERDPETERRVLSPEEQIDFFDTCKGTFYDELFTVAVLTGLRPGELFALRWKDIDMRRRIIKVTRTLVYQKLGDDTQKTFHIDPPKTDASLREVSFDERCEIALKKQFRKKSMVALGRNARPVAGLEDLLFVTKYDTPINSQIYCDAIKRIVDLINESRSDADQFEIFSGHCFRHTYATRCFEAGVAPKVVQKQLGHASLKMTMDLYTHVLDQKKDDDLDKFYSLSGEILNGSDELAEQRYKETLHPKVVSL